MSVVQRWLLACALAAVAVSGLPNHGHDHHVAVAAERTVIFNTQSLKYHQPGCIAARRCTRNCIFISLSEAIKRGGVPCKICGG
jgi:hypothetical protein